MSNPWNAERRKRWHLKQGDRAIGADNVQRAAAVIDSFGGDLAEHSHMLANALADAGLIPHGEAEVTVEWGYRSYEGHVIRCASEQIARDQNEAGRDLAFATQGVVQRTVTTHRSGWTEVGDG